MKRLVLMLFLSLSAPAQITDEFTNLIANFHFHWDKFTRAYLGCPKDAKEVEQCNPNLGTIDYAEFLKARKAAKKLFGLQESNYAEAK